MFGKIFLLFLLGFEMANARACCCVPSASCVAVQNTMEIATSSNKTDVSTEDESVGSSWNNSIERTMIEIEELKKISLKHQKNIKNLDYANIIESYKEEFNYLSILNYKINSFDTKVETNKSLLTDSELSIRISKLNLDIDNDIKEFLKK